LDPSGSAPAAPTGAGTPSLPVLAGTLVSTVVVGVTTRVVPACDKGVAEDLED